jgi:uncharacterized linocin/CFP29 family protein
MIHSFNPDPNAPVSIDYMVPADRQISMGGNWARQLIDNELDVGCMRPYIDNRNRSWITRNIVNPETGKSEQKPVMTRNDNATLRILDWIQLDEAIIRASKERLRAVRQLREAGLVYMLPNGIAKTVMQFQQQSDISGATISMDGIREGESDRPVFSTVNFPIPIIHKDFQFSLREIMASRTGYSPLDLTTAELAGRRVAEQVEQLTIGTSNAAFLGAPSYAYGGATIYGYMNFPGRISWTITLPTAVGWTPDQTINDVLQMKRVSQAAKHYGPWMLYCGLNWDPYMDDDYKPTYNSTTLRQRLRDIDGIIDIQTLDYIPDYSLLLVQQTTDVVRLVIGMDITTVQWESHGGMQLNFKVMCVIVPQLRSDYYGNTGIIHGA